MFFILSNPMGTPEGTGHHVLLAVLPLGFHCDQVALWVGPTLHPKPTCPRPSPSCRSSWLHYHFLLLNIVPWNILPTPPQNAFIESNNDFLWPSLVIFLLYFFSLTLESSCLLSRDVMAEIGSDCMCESCFSSSGLVSKSLPPPPL